MGLEKCKAGHFCTGLCVLGISPFNMHAAPWESRYSIKSTVISKNTTLTCSHQMENLSEREDDSLYAPSLGLLESNWTPFKQR